MNSTEHLSKQNIFETELQKLSPKKLNLKFLGYSKFKIISNIQSEGDFVPPFFLAKTMLLKTDIDGNMQKMPFFALFQKIMASDNIKKEI